MAVRFGMAPSWAKLPTNPRQQDFWDRGLPAGSLDAMEKLLPQAFIDAAVKDLIDKAFGRAVWILERNRALLDRSAKELLIKETFSKEDLQQLRRSVIPDLNQGTSARLRGQRQPRLFSGCARRHHRRADNQQRVEDKMKEWCAEISEIHPHSNMCFRSGVPSEDIVRAARASGSRLDRQMNPQASLVQSLVQSPN